MDSKNRLVLPLEIRDALGIKNNERITFSVSVDNAEKDEDNGTIIITLAKAKDENGVKCSRNCENVVG